MRKSLAAIIIALGFAAGLAACGSSAKPTPSAPNGGTPTTAATSSGGGGYSYG